MRRASFVCYALSLAVLGGGFTIEQASRLVPVAMALGATLLAAGFALSFMAGRR